MPRSLQISSICSAGWACTQALEGTGLAPARRGLEGLYDQHLLTEPAHGRYRMHDLIREHAGALAAREDSGADRAQSTGRLLDYYQHAAGRAEALDAALHLGVGVGRANALHNLGDVRWLTGDYPAAAQALKQALGIYRQ